jgi:hypothetical protein
MKQLSRWAKFHPAHARIIIVISHTLLIFLAFNLSKQVIQTGIQFSPLWLYGVLIAFFIAGMFYPRDKARSDNYAKRKTFDFTIALLGFFLFFFSANELNQPAPSGLRASVPVTVEPVYKNAGAEKLLNAFKTGEKTSFSKKEKRIIKQEFNYQLKKWVKAKVTGDKATASQALLILLSCIVAAGLIYLVASLACTLSCGGSDVAAVIVVVLGTAAVVWLLIRVIKSISRRSKK